MTLSAWESFYVIVGSSAGALTGLQFVTMALIADMPVTQGIAQASDAFSTPTIVHFSAVLMLSALLSAPWEGVAAPMTLCGAAGVVGLGYSIIVLRRVRSQPSYTPVFEDWLFHVVLPAAAYAMLVVSGVVVRTHAQAALSIVAIAALLLLFVGIHNVWDSTTYIVFVRRREQDNRGDQRR